MTDPLWSSGVKEKKKSFHFIIFFRLLSWPQEIRQPLIAIFPPCGVALLVRNGAEEDMATNLH